MQQRNRVLVFAVLISLASSALFGQSLTLDAGFGDGGTLLDADAGFAIRSVLVQPDGRILFLGVGAAGDVLGRYLANGAPDPSFAVPPIPSMTLWGMALQTDGKIVVVGYSGSDFGIVRLLPGGSPDPAFDGDGHDSVDFSGGFDHATAVAIQSDGKIVVAGFAEVAPGAGTQAIAIVRYLTDGILDPTFGSGGKVMGPVQSLNVYSNRVLIDSLGRIIAGSSLGGILEDRFGPARFSSSGVLDTSFGNAGSIELPFDFTGFSMALTPNDELLIVGRHSSSTTRMQLLRYTDVGLPDADFGANGQVLVGVSPLGADAQDAAVLADGRFYVAGSWSGDFYLGRFLEDGTLDASFGVGGFLLTTFPSSGSFDSAEAFDLFVRSDADVTLAGRASVSDTEQGAAVARYVACPGPSDPPPTITSLSISEAIAIGPSAYLEISGTGFSPEVSVRFGDSSPRLTFVSPTLLGVQLDVHYLGDVDVVVRNPDCQSATLPRGLFFYPRDVLPGSLYYPFVKKLIRNGVTAGCTTVDFCPRDLVTRAQMAVFLLRSKEGATYQPPPATGTLFADVPIDGFAAAWIEELSRRNITAGCDVTLYCPDQFNTRAQMAVFLLVTLEGTGYQPPDPDGIFLDVPVSSPYARWIEEIFARGITSGCGQGIYCPNDAVLREQMAVFLSVTFSLPG